MQQKNEINMATILSNVSDESLLTQLKKSMSDAERCSFCKSTEICKGTRCIQTTGYKEAMADVQNGSAAHYESVNQLFEELGIAAK